MPQLFKVPTGSTGPGGPIFDIFDPSGHIADPNDPRLTGVNLSGLPEGQAPTGFQSQFEQAPAGSTTGPTDPLANVRSQEQNPITKFNLAILDMLTTAQKSGGNLGLFQQQRKLQRAAIGRTSEITPEELRVLSPGQQAAIRSGSVAALRPEIDAVAAEIKARDSRLQNFESILGQVQQLGGDIAKNMTPPPEVIDSYKFILRSGGSPTSIPAEIRNKVLAQMTPEDWDVWRGAQADTARKTQIVKLANGNTVLIDTQTGEVIKSLGGGADQTSGLEIETGQNLVDKITALKTHSGLNNAVGPRGIFRLGGKTTGNRQDFIGSVEQLVSGLSLDALVEAKSRGATFGALSDSEMRILSAAATKIGTWRVVKDDNVTGYNVSEKAFKAELDEIQRLTNLAIERAGGTSGGLSPEEEQGLMTNFETFNPESFF